MHRENVVLLIIIFIVWLDIEFLDLTHSNHLSFFEDLFEYPISLIMTRRW